MNSSNYTKDLEYVYINGVKYYNFNDTYEGTYGIFLNTKTKSGKFYIMVNLFLLLYYTVPLIWIIKYRNWYIFRQRNFILTFIGGIANFISTTSNSITPVLKIPCAYAYYSATVATSMMQICYVFRAFRLILLYKLNIFKVTVLDKNKFIKYSKEGNLVEPNIYFKSLYKLVNKKLARIIIPTVEIIVTVVAVSLHIYSNIGHSPLCGIKPVDINARINSEIHGHEFITRYNITDFSKVPEQVSTYHYMRTMFRFPEYLTIMFVLVCIVITITFAVTDIKDSQHFGVKFDCLSSAIISILVGSIYFFFRIQMENIIKSDPNEKRDRNLFTFHQAYLRSKQGIVYFVFIGVYIQLTSVVIPLVQCIYTEYLNKKYTNEPINELEHFHKVLRQAELLEELKDIAIREFSVENILFYENYRLLHKLVIRVTKHHKEEGDTMDNYGEMYSLQDIIHDSTLSNSNRSEGTYDPGYPLLPQLEPYFNSFYYTFIDIDGPAPVNITANTISRINHEFNTGPTVGIFDEALNEVIETMFFSIYPIFLSQNRHQIGELYENDDL